MKKCLPIHFISFILLFFPFSEASAKDVYISDMDEVLIQKINPGHEPIQGAQVIEVTYPDFRGRPLTARYSVMPDAGAFLQTLAEQGELAIWTDSGPERAIPILKKIRLPNGQTAFDACKTRVLTRGHMETVISESGGVQYVKDFRKITTPPRGGVDSGYEGKYQPYIDKKLVSSDQHNVFLFDDSAANTLKEMRGHQIVVYDKKSNQARDLDVRGREIPVGSRLKRALGLLRIAQERASEKGISVSDELERLQWSKKDGRLRMDTALDEKAIEQGAKNLGNARRIQCLKSMFP